MRRLKAGLYNVGAYYSLSEVLKPLVDRDREVADSDLDEEAIFERYTLTPRESEGSPLPNSAIRILPNG